jgi:hypothetical protein
MTADDAIMPNPAPIMQLAFVPSREPIFLRRMTLLADQARHFRWTIENRHSKIEIADCPRSSTDRTRVS